MTKKTKKENLIKSLPAKGKLTFREQVALNRGSKVHKSKK